MSDIAPWMRDRARSIEDMTAGSGWELEHDFGKPEQFEVVAQNVGGGSLSATLTAAWA